MTLSRGLSRRPAGKPPTSRGLSRAITAAGAGGIPFNPIVAAGGTVTEYNDGTNDYRVHTFNSSGDFIVTDLGDTGGEIDYLIVAGGASGSNFTAFKGGGGGAGGLRTGSGTVTVATFPVVIGAGGASVTGTNPGLPGGNSSFNGLTATGGGRGGNNSSTQIPGNGGSGGGVTANSAGTSTPGGTGIAGQGFAGGAAVSAGASDFQRPASGGGGAGAVGGGGSNSTGAGGNGGIGVQSDINGTLTYYAGGGGGSGGAPGGAAFGTGGLGGGGNGSATTASVGGSGTANTGGGGGGGSSGSGAGGSGVVIVRYPLTNFP